MIILRRASYGDSRFIRVSYIIICNGLAMTNTLRTDTRVHTRARGVERPWLVCDSAALVRQRVREGRIPRVSSYTTTAW